MNYTLNSSPVEREHDEEVENIKAFTHGLCLYFPPFMIIIGSVCNILVVMVMRTVQFRYLSTSFYMCSNAAIDIFSLIVLLTVDWLHTNFPWTIFRGEHAHYMCKFFHFVGATSSDLGIILTAVMTLERGLAIMFPLKSSSWCTVKRARHVTIFLFCFTSVKNANYLFTSDIHTSHESDRLCYVYADTEALSYFWKSVWPWIHNTFLVLSFISIIFSNVIIIRHIRKSDKLRSKSVICHRVSSATTVPHKLMRRSQSRRRQIAIMLLIDSFTVIICTTPFSVYTTVDSNTTFLDGSEYQKAVKHLIASFSFYLLYVNRCANFYLYCLSGSRFRNALKQTLCFCNKEDSLAKKMQLYSSRFQESSEIDTYRHSTLKLDNSAYI
ncbi:hypothetical protein FSP39_019427 [Pinctada imbricata]|uniref:G-protein coupled receptors family 1 profile domain-containing protein n=1 Tax=Pinctada imbricata TaxID=66713 RepID=A0AA88YGS7_PINIB|nr:hypothetical protein FSP39_019427 [Pinctada imbricata]